jgi:hypothetical protein
MSGRVRILVVEDEPDLLRIAVYRLVAGLGGGQSGEP